MTHAFDPSHPAPVPLGVVASAAGTEHHGDTPVTGVAVSAGDVRPGALFAALPGRRTHGAEHTAAAAAAGAAAVLTDQAGADRARATGLPVLVVDDPRAALGAVAVAVYGTDRLPFPVFGVTGTNGKTTTVHVLDALMRRLDRRTAHSSTVDRRIGDTAAASALTTPEAPELHAFLATAAESGVEGVALEISAQALTRHRTDGVVVDVAGFTNLSHDHLDDYADMDDYLAAKAVLFTPERSRAGVVSLDSPAGRRIVAGASVPVTTVTTRTDVSADWVVRITEQRHDGTSGTVVAPDGSVLPFAVPLLGVHAAADTGLALAMLAVSGVPLDALRTATSAPLDVAVPGRMADASASTGPRVWVDFAHTPDAFAKSLDAVRAVVSGAVAIVVGADGDRDPSKRHAMGVVAASGADVVVVTDHHPRTEAPGPIRATILAGARSVSGAVGSVVVEEPDPARAIRRAIAMVGGDGAVYWAGPGLTDYRDVAGAHVPYSSFRDAQRALAEAGHPQEARELADTCR
ncbi:UDP-N-acetylmuramoyl-L-alanyl-D-glutamate--2,6-diaminopimelate ligase [Curtobacterium sp. MCSS17_008]|uniref:Mur ligase family protein n=1 Tax=Curtobacterium sp. MCSS17_008 TaxID=2175647 RepID=UPI000DA92A9B|nr:UDP-N-acetylmuramyl-tripeptide synthetase [Curtobacterium sp. MCSS17_008]PZF58219.1 UDP-N-acetylmuramoyl-L-alanyl-D-glutamate--2,6-diaminopimelate ligase [Curtobacterium sp. MCSS17_008]